MTKFDDDQVEMAQIIYKEVKFFWRNDLIKC